MGTFVRLVDGISEWAGKLASLLLIPLVLITCFEVFMRYVVAMPTIWAWDLNIQIFAAIVMLGGAEALRKGAHIVVDVVVDKAKPRTRAILDLITAPIFFFGMLVLLAGGWDQFSLSWRMPGGHADGLGASLLHNEVHGTPRSLPADAARCGGVLEETGGFQGPEKGSLNLWKAGWYPP